MTCVHPRTVYICLGCGKRSWYRLEHDTDAIPRPSARKYVKMQHEPKWLQRSTCVEHEEKKLQKCRPGGAVLGAEPERKKLKEAQCAAKKIAEPERSSTARVPSQCEPMMQSNQIPPTPVSWIAEPERKKLKKAQSAPW